MTSNFLQLTGIVDRTGFTTNSEMEWAKAIRRRHAANTHTQSKKDKQAIPTVSLLFPNMNSPTHTHTHTQIPQDSQFSVHGDRL